MPIISTLGRGRRGDQKFKVTVSYIAKTWGWGLEDKEGKGAWDVAVCV